MKKIILTAVVTTSLMFATNAQIVTIPDANFKAYLVGNAAINTNADTEIQESEATAYTGSINCDNLGITDLTGIEAFTALYSLNCADNQLTNLDLNANTALVSLDCSGNFLTNLDLNNNTAINALYCFNNQLANLDLTNNTALAHLFCQTNQINNLDISNNNALQILYCQNNQIMDLDVSANTALEQIYCANNQITTLNLSANTALERLYCGNNQISTLNVNNSTSLTRLSCSNNQLSSLYVKNGNNANFITFASENNPNLLCIEVDDPVYCEDNWLFIDAASSFSEDCNACIVTIPDANFKAYLLGNTAINTNGDNEIQCGEADTFTGSIECSGLSISDLTGIEEFLNITNLDCSNNNLTAVYLSNNTLLTNLLCFNNDLTTLNVANNPNLTQLYCGENPLNALNISANSSLNMLSVGGTLLTNIDISNCPNLTTLLCGNNSLTTLNVSNNTALTTLSCGYNSLTSLDVSNNLSLAILICQSNQLTTLDLSSNTSLSSIDCSGNQLTSLNVKNGNNSTINNSSFNALYNANLDCIEVDNATYSTTTWLQVDADVIFSEDCASLGINEQVNEIVKIYPNPAQTDLNIEMKEATQINIVNILGEIVLKQNFQIGNNSINVSELSSGVYLIQTENGTTLKFVKE